jgi:YHS domain-containing protein
MTTITLILAAFVAVGQPEKPKPLPTPPVTQPAKAAEGDPYALPTCAACDASIEGTKPYITVSGTRELRFCCAMCEAKFDKDAQKSLAALDAQMVKDQLPHYPLKTSVVTGAPLPDGDKTINLIYNNRLIRLGGEAEKGEFGKDPKKYLKLVDEAVIREQGKNYPLKKCPVSDEAYGGEMGDPVDVVVANRLVRLCCKSCKRDLKEDPAKFIAKVDAASKK